MDAMKLVYPGHYVNSIDGVEAIAQEFEFWYEESDQDEIVMVLEGTRPAQDYAQLARTVADEVIPTFSLEVYVENHELLDTVKVFEAHELEADYETRY